MDITLMLFSIFIKTIAIQCSRAAISANSLGSLN